MDTSDTTGQLSPRGPYVLVLMGYESAGDARPWDAIFAVIKEVVEGSFGMECWRAKDILRAGHELLPKIHSNIERAALIIADVSEERADVYYEAGYAAGLNKRPILLAQAGTERSYNLRGLEVLEYTNTFHGLPEFRRKLADLLRLRLRADEFLLRQMLAPRTPRRSYIVADPKSAGNSGRGHGGVYDWRTFGDQLGVLGIIAAFGVLYGDAAHIELISAASAPPTLLQQDINLFLIGSSKVYPPVREILAKIIANRQPAWEFEHEEGPDAPEVGDWPVAFYRRDGTQRTRLDGERTQIGGADNIAIRQRDRGLLVRGPHPEYRDRMVLLMAGAHSLGTAAACLAATRATLIKKISDSLPPGIIEDRSRTFWVLVEGVASTKDYLLDEEDVRIEDAGVYD